MQSKNMNSSAADARKCNLSLLFPVNTINPSTVILRFTREMPLPDRYDPAAVCCGSLLPVWLPVSQQPWADALQMQWWWRGVDDMEAGVSLPFLLPPHGHFKNCTTVTHSSSENKKTYPMNWYLLATGCQKKEKRNVLLWWNNHIKHRIMPVSVWETFFARWHSRHIWFMCDLLSVQIFK